MEIEFDLLEILLELVRLFLECLWSSSLFRRRSWSQHPFRWADTLQTAGRLCPCPSHSVTEIHRYYWSWCYKTWWQKRPSAEVNKNQYAGSCSSTVPWGHESGQGGKKMMRINLHNNIVEDLKRACLCVKYKCAYWLFTPLSTPMSLWHIIVVILWRNQVRRTKTFIMKSWNRVFVSSAGYAVITWETSDTIRQT